MPTRKGSRRVSRIGSLADLNAVEAKMKRKQPQFGEAEHFNNIIENDISIDY